MTVAYAFSATILKSLQAKTLWWKYALYFFILQHFFDFIDSDLGSDDASFHFQLIYDFLSESI
jgi:hypothetical protein